MDKFYLENVALYESLVERATPAPLARRAGQPTDLVEANMLVAARIRPQLGEDLASGFPCAVYPRSGAEDGVVDIHDLYHHPRGKPVLKSAKYEVDRLFGPETTTEEIFDVHVKHLTFTVSRLEELVVEALVDLDPDSEKQVSITIIELAGNTAFDLLNKRQPISIMEDAKGVTRLVGANECFVKAHADVQDLIERATKFRRTAPTLKNDDSSRSHSICRIRIKHGRVDGFLYLVDLAGSEGARDVAVHGADRMRETREINISLSVLKDCIRGRAQADAIAEASRSRPAAAKKKQAPHIPFRQSALTKVLKHVFDPAGGRASKTAVIACVNPSLADVGPSKNTLRYAEILRVTAPSSAATATSTSTSTTASTSTPAKTAAATAAASTPQQRKPQKPFQVSSKPNSRDPDPEAADVPFRHRLRPAGRPPMSRDGGDVGSPDKARRNRTMRYVCASLVPVAGKAYYEMNLWDQCVVESSMMDREVILEYNPETRYYYVYHIV
ncbi:P-loop containing nucleoside triphosphate hydrolase protein [Apiospora saccharicola]